VPLHAPLVFLPNLEDQFDSWYLKLFLIALRKSYLNSNLLNPLKFSLRDLVHMLSFLSVAAPTESLDTSQLTTWFCKKFRFIWFVDFQRIGFVAWQQFGRPRIPAKRNQRTRNAPFEYCPRRLVSCCRILSGCNRRLFFSRLDLWGNR